MSIFDWFKGSQDPQEPASPPPFRLGDRVIVSPAVQDGMFIGGAVGEVIAAEFITDPDNPYGPWQISVLLDESGLKMAFHAAELTREPKPATHLPRRVVKAAHADDFEAYTGQGEVPADGSTPLYDDVMSSAMAADGLAAEVEAYLKDAS